MPRFARLFEAAADTLNAYYQAVADANLDALLALWLKLLGDGVMHGDRSLLITGVLGLGLSAAAVPEAPASSHASVGL